MLHHIMTRLADYYPDYESRELAWWILEETTGKTRTQLLSDCKDTTNIPNIEIILARLQKKEPIQYIFGHTPWRGLDIRLSPATLIPRPETAELVDLVEDFIRRAYPDTPLRILDACTGSGCIAIALACDCPRCEVAALDYDSDLLALAADNARRHQAHVRFFPCDLLATTIAEADPAPGKPGQPPYDILVSNPPYIALAEQADMEPSVLDYEPHAALFVPDDDPLLFYRHLAEQHPAHHLFFEINPRYAEALAELLHSLQYTDIQIHTDTYEKARFLTARYGA